MKFANVTDGEYCSDQECTDCCEFLGTCHVALAASPTHEEGGYVALISDIAVLVFSFTGYSGL